MRYLSYKSLCTESIKFKLFAFPHTEHACSVMLVLHSVRDVCSILNCYNLSKCCTCAHDCNRSTHSCRNEIANCVKILSCYRTSLLICSRNRLRVIKECLINSILDVSVICFVNLSNELTKVLCACKNSFEFCINFSLLFNTGRYSHVGSKPFSFH